FVTRDLVAGAVERREAADAPLDARAHEPVAAIAQRLAPLPGDASRVADLEFRAPFAAEVVDLRAVVHHEQVVSARAAEVVLDVQAEAEPVGAEVLRRQADDQAVLAVAFDEFELDALERADRV